MSSATDYDGTIIGSGPNGLGLAAYLSRAGMRILVVEARDKVGGGLCTEEVIPGYRTNLHAIAIWGYPPIHRDFNLAEYGVKFIRPPVETGFLLRDARSFTIYQQQPKVNFKVIAKFSPRDARTISRLYRDFAKTRIREYYSPPGRKP